MDEKRLQEARDRVLQAAKDFALATSDLKVAMDSTSRLDDMLSCKRRIEAKRAERRAMIELDRAVKALRREEDGV